MKFLPTISSIRWIYLLDLIWDCGLGTFQCGRCHDARSKSIETWRWWRWADVRKYPSSDESHWQFLGTRPSKENPNTLDPPRISPHLQTEAVNKNFEKLELWRTIEASRLTLNRIVFWLLSTGLPLKSTYSLPSLEVLENFQN